LRCFAIAGSSTSLIRWRRLIEKAGQKTMERTTVNSIELEYEIKGAGEPVILMHAGVCAEWFKPLMTESALIGRFLVVRYHRVGYVGSSHVTGSVSIVQQAGHCLALMHSLGIGRAHIVGHSSSANIAIQLALDVPQAAHSLALLEPALYEVPSAKGPARAFVASALEHYGAGNKARAVDTFMRGVCGPNYLAPLEHAVPGALEQAAADADTFFEQELPALRGWSFSRENASCITQPVLAVIGGKSDQVSPIWRERQELLLAWLPNVEPFVLPNATHLLHAENPGGMALGLADFFARHPLAMST
jgi:pimeloyl-ACP methyl ester carboxylesterase